MQLGFVSAILPELTFEQVIDFARDEHFSTVEVVCWPAGRAERRFAGVTHIDVDTLTGSQAQDIQARSREAGVNISALGYYPNMLDTDPEVAGLAVTHFKKVITAASALGLSTVNGFVGRDWTRSVDENWPGFLATWRPLVKYAEDHGVKIGIENCPMSFTRDEWPGGKNLFTTPAIWRRAFNDIDSPNFGLNYDPSHFVLQDMDPVSPLAEFKDRMFHIHAKDVAIDRVALNEVGRFDFPLNWHQPRIPGFGSINWPQFMAELMRVGYDGPVCIEVEDDTFGKSLHGRKQALRVARNVLAPFILPTGLAA